MCVNLSLYSNMMLSLTVALATIALPAPRNAGRAQLRATTCSVTTMCARKHALRARLEPQHTRSDALSMAGFAGSHGYPSDLAACLHLQLQRCALPFRKPLRYRNHQPTAPVSQLGRTAIDLIRPPQPPNAAYSGRMYLAVLPTTSCSC